MLAGLLSFIEIRQVKNLHNLVEQDHRFIKKATKPMMGFKALHSAKASIRRDLKFVKPRDNSSLLGIEISDGQF